jgi:hypothetical protein
MENEFDPDLIEKMAKAIYNANSRELVWENTSENVKEWVRRQARAILVDKDNEP